jgi:hypothetical protein
MVQFTDAERERAYCQLSFYRWEGRYDITDYYRVLIVSQGAFDMHRFISLHLFGIVVSCNSEEAAITNRIQKNVSFCFMPGLSVCKINAFFTGTPFREV